MKILYVITCADRGGAQVALLDLVLHLPEGYEAVVAAGENGFLQQGCERAGIPFRVIRGLVRQIDPISDLFALVRTIALIGRERPQVVHAHTTKAGLIARVAAWITRTPSVFTVHTWSYDNGVSRLVRWLGVPLEKFAALLGGQIITVSDANTEKGLSRSITSKENIVRIWLGIPNTKLRAKREMQRHVRMIMVARFVEQKDQGLLLRALSGVYGSWELQLVGSGPMIERAQALAVKLNLDKRVHFLGERSDVPELLAQADIYILSTKWEGLPVSILEAMRAGLPVIATDVGGINEMVKDGVTGLLARPSDADHLCDRIQTLVNSPELRVNMGDAARLSFEENFQIEVSVRNTVAVYDAMNPWKESPSGIAEGKYVR
jgi:glycosyltransferase involved in cell wall biosynthesis